MYVHKFSRHRLYAGLRLDYRLRLWAPTSALHTISVVAELLVEMVIVAQYIDMCLGASEAVIDVSRLILRAKFQGFSAIRGTPSVKSGNFTVTPQ